MSQNEQYQERAPQLSKEVEMPDILTHIFLQVLWSPKPYELGEVFCIARGLAAETSTNASVLTIAAFTVERYIGICHPIRSQTMEQLGRVLKIIVAVWVVACMGAVPQAIQYGIEDQECKVKKNMFRLSQRLAK